MVGMLWCLGVASTTVAASIILYVSRCLTPRPTLADSVRTCEIDGMTVTYRDDAHVDTPELVAAFPPFHEWVDALRGGLNSQGAIVHKVHVRDLLMFGPRIGFLVMDVDAFYGGVKLPGYVVLSGPSVAVLLWFNHENRTHAILVRQPRIATGNMTWEVPAGRMDNQGTLRSAMLNEIREETGLSVENTNEMRELSSAPHASPGLLDETFRLFSLEVTTGCVLERLAQRGDAAMGCRDEGEIITRVSAFPVDSAPKEDAKFCILLDAARRDGVL